jgi:hypothetical protein
VNTVRITSANGASVGATNTLTYTIQ